jgi:excisionase family DNA binding protein
MQEPASKPPQAIVFANLAPEEFFRRQREEFLAATEDALRALLKRVELGPYLTPARVCELTGWSRRKLGYLQAEGRLPFYQEGRSILFKTEDVLAFIEEGEVPARGCEGSLYPYERSGKASGVPTANPALVGRGTAQ